MIDVLDWQTSNIKHIKYYYFIIFLHIQHCSTLFYKNSIYTFRISNFFSLKKEMRNHWKKKAQRNYWKKKPLKKEMVFRGIFCHVAFYLQAQRQTLNTKKRGRVPSKITNSCTATNVDCLLVWFLPVDLSGLVVPARGSRASAGWVLRIIETHKPLHHGKVAVYKRGVSVGFSQYLRTSCIITGKSKVLWDTFESY